MPVGLFPTHIVGGGVDNQPVRQYDVAPDGRFLINAELNGAAAPITLLNELEPRREEVADAQISPLVAQRLSILPGHASDRALGWVTRSRD